MFSSHFPRVYHIFLRASIFILILLLAACDSPTTTHPASSTTVAVATATSGATVKTYTGAKFKLTYPQGWQVQGTGDQVIIQDAQGLNALTIILAANAGEKQSAQSLASSIFPSVEKAILSDPEPMKLAGSVTVAGEPWVQQGATGTLSTGGQSQPGTLILLLDNHPTHAPRTQAYEMYYGGPSATFEQMQQTAFEVMLRSFTFVG